MLQTFVTRPVELLHLTYRRATGRAHGSAFRGAKSSESGDGDADPDPSDDLSDKASAASEALAKSDSKLVGTPNHPFWSVTRQTWVEMGRLQPGERLLLADGREAVVETLEREYAPAVFENWIPGQATTGTLGTPADPNTGTFTCYNFEVADWHTYFVSDVGAAVWVHNQGALCPEIIEAAKRKPELVNKMNLDQQVRAQLQEMGLLPTSKSPLFRTGSQTDKQLTDPTGVSFRDSVSSSADPRVINQQVFRPGDKIYAVDPNKLPPGSVRPDGTPYGHVGVNATPEQIRQAIIPHGPDNPLSQYGMKMAEDGSSYRLPK